MRIHPQIDPPRTPWERTYGIPMLITVLPFTQMEARTDTGGRPGRPPPTWLLTTKWVCIPTPLPHGPVIWLLLTTTRLEFT
jgi:hypothetical protein